MVIMILSINKEYILSFSVVPFSFAEAGKLYSHIIRFKSWPSINRFKKHKSVDHCPIVLGNIASFYGKWWGVSGIYKITFLPFRLFTYYGSSVNLGQRFKYHYYNSGKASNFLALFINSFGWRYFSITVVEVCPRNELKDREDYYLATFNPLLNVETQAYTDPRSNTVSNLTRSKISLALFGRKDSDEVRARKSEGSKGSKNHNYGVGPNVVTLDAAAEANGIKVYVYEESSFIRGSPFRSIRQAATNMKMGSTTLTGKLNTGKAYKGHYYYTSPRQC